MVDVGAVENPGGSDAHDEDAWMTTIASECGRSALGDTSFVLRWRAACLVSSWISSRISKAAAPIHSKPAGSDVSEDEGVVRKLLHSDAVHVLGGCDADPQWWRDEYVVEPEAVAIFGNPKFFISAFCATFTATLDRAANWGDSSDEHGVLKLT